MSGLQRGHSSLASRYDNNKNNNNKKKKKKAKKMDLLPITLVRSVVS